MSAERYLTEIASLIERFREREIDAVESAASAAADRVQQGGALHHFDTGHMKEEPIRRAGGLFGLHHLELRVEAEGALPPGRRPRLTPLAQRYFYDREDLAPLLLDKSHIEAGDVLIQVSNSGKEPFTVGVGLEAKKRGAFVIAMTSVEFSRALEPKHSSGKRLFEVADAVIDMHAPPSDAVVELDGLSTPVGATSGVLTGIALWSFMTALSAALLARGIQPAVYRSVNLPDGFAFNETQETRYRENGI